MFPMPPSLLLPLRLQKALAMCVLTAPQNLQFESPSRPVLDVAVLFTVAVLASLPTGKQATSTHVSPNELRNASATRATTNSLGWGLCGLVAGTELFLEKRNSKPPFKFQRMLCRCPIANRAALLDGQKPKAEHADAQSYKKIDRKSASSIQGLSQSQGWLFSEARYHIQRQRASGAEGCAWVWSPSQVRSPLS